MGDVRGFIHQKHDALEDRHNTDASSTTHENLQYLQSGSGREWVNPHVVPLDRYRAMLSLGLAENNPVCLQRR